MDLETIAKELDLEVVTASVKLERQVTGGYASDLLSDVLANAKEGNVWITLQIHQNIVGVATMKGIAGVIVVNGRKPEPDVIRKAEEEGIAVMVSSLPAFEVVGRLYRMGVVGVE
jgi:hypothetical protein